MIARDRTSFRGPPASDVGSSASASASALGVWDAASGPATDTARAGREGRQTPPLQAAAPPSRLGARSTAFGPLLLLALLTAAGCGSDYSAETTPIGSNVQHGDYSFDHKDGLQSGRGDGAFGGGASGADGARQPGDAACGAACSVDGDCASSAGLAPGTKAAQCQAPVCVAGCCKAAPAADGASCDDGDPCTGPDLCGGGVCKAGAAGCDDGLDCTADSCDPGGAGCLHTPLPGWCLLDGACIEDGEAKDGAPCSICAPTTDAKAWTSKPGCCVGDADCVPLSVCDAPTCDVTNATCVPGKKLGCCLTDAECVDGDACTVDGCDPANGKCTSAPKACPDASPCQLGGCDAVSGQCTLQVAANQCAIAGSCHVAGAPHPSEPCLSCQPSVQAEAWSATAGKPCDDNEVCTVNDVCSDKGSCIGQSKYGCCQVDAHCAVYASACVAASCDLQAHICIKQDKAGCCESGACCDPATNQQKPKGVMCSAVIAAVEYQCQGQQIRRREHYPGCTGADATVCSSDAAYLYAGDWSDVATCPGDTQCVAVASGEKPDCKAKGSCAGACGAMAAGGACACSPGCEAAGTCCADYKAQCACGGGACCAGGLFAAKGSACGGAASEFQCSGQQVQKRTGAASCTGGSATCPAPTFGAWSTVQTCGSGQSCVAAADKSSATCQGGGGGQTCSGKCGGQGAGGCWCDAACVKAGDCCPDFAKFCGNACGKVAASTCKGKCGGLGAGGCWCDAACVQFGDCCGDHSACCP